MIYNFPLMDYLWFDTLDNPSYTVSQYNCSGAYSILLYPIFVETIYLNIFFKHTEYDSTIPSSTQVEHRKYRGVQTPDCK